MPWLLSLVAALIAAGSLAVATLGYLNSRQTRRDVQQSTVPNFVVTATPKYVMQDGAWVLYEIAVTAENRSSRVVGLDWADISVLGDANVALTLPGIGLPSTVPAWDSARWRIDGQRLLASLEGSRFERRGAMLCVEVFRNQSDEPQRWRSQAFELGTEPEDAAP